MMEQIVVITDEETGFVVTLGQVGPRGPTGPAGVGSLSLSDDPPVMNGTASPGTSEEASRGDHRHPTDTSRASAAALTALQNSLGTMSTVDDAPNDGSLYGRQDGVWAEIPDPGAGGGSTPSAQMQWKADATSGDPGFGRLGTDTGTISTTTTLYIDTNSKNAINISGFLQNLKAGASVYLYELRNTVNWAIFDVLADAVDVGGSYYSVSVAPRAYQGIEPGDYADIGAFFSFGTSGGGSGDAAWGSITGTLSAQTDLQAALDAKLDESAVSAYGLSLIDDTDAAAARTTLGLGSAATTASTAYATAAQGAKADTAVQPGDLATIATTGDVGDLVGFPGGTSDFLRADGTFATPPGGGGGSGDVVGPSSAVNNRVVFFDGTSGKLIKDSGLSLSGTNTGDQTSVTGNAGTATALQTARTIDGVSFDGTANITVIAPATHAATSKSTPVDADELPLVDSAASNVLKRLTWANLKATLKTYFDTLYSTVGFANPMTTAGDLIVGGASGAAARLAKGTAYQGLRMNSGATAAEWAAVTTCIPIACSDETTALTTGAAKVTFRMPFAMKVTAVRASLTTAQASGSIFTVDINETGSSILSTKLTIDNTEKTSTTAAAAPVISDADLADDAEITIDIDQIGDGTAKGLKVYLIGYVAQ